MEAKWFTKETAWLEHPRGGKIKLGEKQKSMAFLSLLVEATGRKKQNIVMEFYRNGLKTYLEEDVMIYLRDRVEHIVEKEVKKIEPKPITKIEELRKIQNNIMRNDKPIPTVQSRPLPPPEWNPFNDWNPSVNKTLSD